jgi:hypothetical protein
MQQKLIAEAFGTFTLALAVLVTLNGVGAVATPIAAALVLGLFQNQAVTSTQPLPSVCGLLIKLKPTMLFHTSSPKYLVDS